MTARKHFKPCIAPERCLYVPSRGRPCAQSAGHGLFLNFCPEHAAYFAAIRADMKRPAVRASIGAWPQNGDEGHEDASLAA